MYQKLSNAKITVEYTNWDGSPMTMTAEAESVSVESKEPKPGDDDYIDEIFARQDMYKDFGYKLSADLLKVNNTYFTVIKPSEPQNKLSEESVPVEFSARVKVPDKALSSIVAAAEAANVPDDARVQIYELETTWEVMFTWQN